VTAAARFERASGSSATSGFDRLVLDSPATRNALSLHSLRKIAQALVVSEAASSRGLIITHTGTALCSGIDLRERRSLSPTDDSHSRLFGEVLLGLWNFPKPVVVAVDGSVRGAGMGLLACGDIVIATPGSTFAYSEVRVGVAPALVMAVTLPGASRRRILPWLLTGEVFGVEDALALGVVTAIDSAARTTGVETTATHLGEAAPQAQRTVKRLFRAAQGVDIVADITAMIAESAGLFGTTEAAEGMASFAERRPPSWAAASETQT
jgi:enoyl-CoA hydratase/carnithine racemase